MNSDSGLLFGGHPVYAAHCAYTYRVV